VKRIVYIYIFQGLSNVPNLNSPFLKNNGAEAHYFKEWRDTRTFSNLISRSFK
jgi:hypothetical protein